MPKQKRTKPYDLIVIAHPDDETIFLGGLVISEPKRNWKVICVTDANADGMGTERSKQFKKALNQLGIKNFEVWEFKDIYEERLPVAQICERLQKIPAPRVVYTHGVLGEYGHPHHQDVCVAVHRSFGSKIPVWSVAYNCFPEKVIMLTERQFRTKAKVFSHTYFSETKRFSQFLPLTFAEGFVRVKLKEVESIYCYWTQGLVPTSTHLKTYRWYWPYIESMGRQIPPRPF